MANVNQVNPSNPSAPPNFCWDNQPLTVISIFSAEFDSSLRWHLTVRDCSGGGATLIIENEPHHLRVCANHFDGSRVKRETVFQHSFDLEERTTLRHSSIADLLGEVMAFPPRQLLVWALLDLDPAATEAALAAGADLDSPLLYEFYALDLVSLAVTSRLQTALRFFGEDERGTTWGKDYQSLDGGDYVNRAVRIRSSLRKAGAKDFAPFRAALKSADYHLAKARLLAGIPIDAQAPDGLTPVLSAIFRQDLTALRWLIRQGADCSIHASILKSLGIAPPEPSATTWLRSGEIAPLLAACLTDFHDGFHALLAEAACDLSLNDYHKIMHHPEAPAWAKDALLNGGYVTQPDEPAKEVSFAWLLEPVPDAAEILTSASQTLRSVFPSSFSHGQPVVDWAECHAPELLDVPVSDTLACEHLIERWVKESGADPSPLLMAVVEANDPSLTELLLPADPTTMGHALLLAMTQANSLTLDCYDFCLYRGCIIDDIRGKGLPEVYQEIAASIAQLLRNHSARDFSHLARAARECDLDTMAREVTAGTPVNFTCDGWGSPLLAAISGGHILAVQWLLTAGADPNLAFDPGTLDPSNGDLLILPLVTAIHHGDVKILKALLDAGADLRSPQMARSRIFENGVLSREIAALVFASPLPLLRNHEGSTCAHLLNEKSLRLSQDLIPDSAWNTRNSAGETPATNVVTRESSNLPFLLSAGASPNAYSGLSPGLETFLWSNYLPDDLKLLALTPLHAAIASRQVVLIEMLLDAGGNIRLPAFTLAEGRSLESCQRLRDILDCFQPAELPPRKRLENRTSFEECQEAARLFGDATRSPAFDSDELNLLCHYLAEDPSRAAQHRDLIIPMSCLDLAKLVDSPLIIEMVKHGGKLPAVSFFASMQEEIRQTLAEYQIVLKQLSDPAIRKPLVFPYMKEMRKLELTLLHRIWQETGTLPTTTLNRDAAMDCLRFATAEFFGGFAEAVEHVEQDGEASIEDLSNVLAENLNPGSTIDLGKFFSNAIAKLRTLERFCKL